MRGDDSIYRHRFSDRAGINSVEAKRNYDEAFEYRDVYRCEDKRGKT